MLDTFEITVAGEALTTKPHINHSQRTFPGRPNLFIDREQELSFILRFLDPIAAPRGILIYGQGGIGKTTTAIESAYRSYLRSDYDEMIFLSAQKAYWDFQAKEKIDIPRQGRFRFASYRGMMLRLEIVLGIFSGGSLEADKRLENIRRELEKRKVLFLIDNLDAISNLTEVEEFQTFINFYLPQGNKAIITSREKLTGISGLGFVEIGLGRMPLSSTYEMLQKLASSRGILIPDSEVEKILTASGSHPLVLEQMVSLMDEIGVNNTLQKIQPTKNEGLLSYLFQSSVDHLSKSAKNILYTISIATFPVNEEFLREVLNITANDLTASLQQLKHWGLINDSAGAYTVHFLIEEYIVQKLREARRWSQWKKKIHDVESKVWR